MGPFPRGASPIVVPEPSSGLPTIHPERKRDFPERRFLGAWRGTEQKLRETSN